MSHRIKYWLCDLLAVVVLVAATLLYFRPLLVSPHDRVVDDYDGLFITWVLDSVTDKVLDLDLKNFFEGNIYYPYPKTLAYSEIFLTDSLLSLPLKLVTDEPVVLYNFALVLAQLLTLLFLYFLLHEITDNRIVAVGMTLVFGFSGLRLHYLGHLQMMSIAFLPLAILSLVKIKKLNSKPWSVIFWVSFVLQTLNSFLAGFFILFAAAGLGGFKKLWKLHLGLALSAGLILAPVVWQFLWVADYFDYQRPLTDVMHFSLSPDQLITTFFSPALFAAFILAYKSRRYFWVGLGAWVMALGPALKWLGQSVKIPFHIPLPYLAFYYLVPGFGGMRTPSRWIVLGALLWTVAAAIGISKLPKRVSYGLATILVMVTMWVVPALPIREVPSRAEYPLVYYWLKEQPEQVVMELPIFRWGSSDFSKQEVYRMLYSTYHHKKLVNGYSGFSPPEWEKMVSDIHNGYVSPRRGGVKLVVVHEDEYARWGRSAPNFGEELFRDGADVVYGRN